MLIGLDVGGTHTDAVLMDADFRCKKGVKVPTTHGHIVNGLLDALKKLLHKENPALVKRVCVSSTLGLNALLTGNADTVGALCVPGPGIRPPAFWTDNPLYAFINGAQDHLGVITAWPDKKEALAALRRFKEHGATAICVVVKFSPKNPELEHWLASLVPEVFPSNTPVFIGSSISGALNFPRRLISVWHQAALARINAHFVESLVDALPKLGLHCPLSILKADAGTISSSEATANPATSLGSGPAASLLGIVALSGSDKDTLMFSIGGTTTDIAFLAEGEPLLNPKGLTIDDQPTLIRSLNTRSLAIGSDSSLLILNDTLQVGPERQGPALSLAPEDTGKRPPTLTDACNVLGLLHVGDLEVSRQA